MIFWYKRTFEKACRSYPADLQRLVAEAVFQVKSWYQTRRAPVGLRIRKLFEGHSGRVFEARASLDLRVVWVEKEETVWFAIVGSHDDVRRFIQAFR